LAFIAEFININPQGFMKRLIFTSAIAGVLSIMSAFAADLKPGDSAPDFSLKGSDGKTYHLADFKGKQPVVIAWFPKAFTGG
jgi:peroxiredoxin Q/BCP